MQAVATTSEVIVKCQESTLKIDETTLATDEKVRKVLQIGKIATTRITQGGHLVYIDTQSSHIFYAG